MFRETSLNVEKIRIIVKGMKNLLIEKGLKGVKNNLTGFTRATTSRRYING